MRSHRIRLAANSCMALALAATVLSCTPSPPYGIAARIEAHPYLQLPTMAGGKVPSLLSQTGVFSNTAQRIPSPELIPYELIVSFWSDGADKSRWVALPRGKIDFSASGEWRFPPGTVFVKNFDMPLDAANPAARRRLETRLLVCDAAGGVYGVVYKWRADGSDADLLSASQTEDIEIKTSSGQIQQTWYFPSRQDCLSCHTANAGGVLGVKARQMNRPFTYPSGVSDNQLRTWNHLGLFSTTLSESDLKSPTLAAADDAARPLQDRARSYLDANCAQCHRPSGTVANFDARYSTPLAGQGLIDGPVLIDQGIDRPRVISPHDIWRSIAYMRVNTAGDIKMPPLARETVDQKGVQLLEAWIDSLPGKEVLAPPSITPAGGTFSKSVEIALSSESGAEIRYTLDGSVPGNADMRYEKPIRLTAPAVLRTRAYKQGMTRSITAEQVYIIAK